MNKSHITSDQVKNAVKAFAERKDSLVPSMRAALEAAFPEPSIQELLRDEERSARHDDPQQPAAFGPLVVSYEMAEHFGTNYHEIDADSLNSYRIALQSFVNRHSIKPIAFADRMPDEGSNIILWCNEDKSWSFYSGFDGEIVEEYGYTHWLPASALPIPEPAVVDPKESAWKEVEDTLSRSCFDRLWESAQQAGGNK